MLAEEWIYQYLERITSELEALVAETGDRSLRRCDTLDLVEYIEAVQRYRQAVAMQKDIVWILSAARRISP